MLKDLQSIVFSRTDFILCSDNSIKMTFLICSIFMSFISSLISSMYSLSKLLLSLAITLDSSLLLCNSSASFEVSLCFSLCSQKKFVKINIFCLSISWVVCCCTMLFVCIEICKIIISLISILKPQHFTSNIWTIYAHVLANILSYNTITLFVFYLEKYTLSWLILITTNRQNYRQDSDMRVNLK